MLVNTSFTVTPYALFVAVTVTFAPMALCNPEALCQSPYFGLPMPMRLSHRPWGQMPMRRRQVCVWVRLAR
jgi:hypothetical protein